MSTTPLPITLVRWPNRDAARKLEDFVFGDRFVGRRPPRGINPEFVSYWIRENWKADCAPGAAMRLLDLLRFYERRDVLDLVGRALTRNETDDRAFRRSCYAVQIIAEIGTFEQASFAARYFVEFLLPLPFAMDFFSLVLETAESLAATLDIAAVGRRLQIALDTASKAPDLDGPGGLNWRKYSDYNRNNLPATALVVEAKRRLLTSDPTQRLPELIMIYLGQSPLSSATMEIWAGRLLRDYAINGGQPALVNALTQLFEAALRSEMPKENKEFFLSRTGHAILYLQGKLSFPHEAAFGAIQNVPAPFLCDDVALPG